MANAKGFGIKDGATATRTSFSPKSPKVPDTERKADVSNTASSSKTSSAKPSLSPMTGKLGVKARLKKSPMLSTPIR